MVFIQSTFWQKFLKPIFLSPKYFWLINFLSKRKLWKNINAKIAFTQIIVLLQIALTEKLKIAYEKLERSMLWYNILFKKILEKKLDVICNNLTSSPSFIQGGDGQGWLDNIDYAIMGRGASKWIFLHN